jgi:hypothetical protein
MKAKVCSYMCPPYLIGTDGRSINLGIFALLHVINVRRYTVPV